MCRWPRRRPRSSTPCRRTRFARDGARRPRRRWPRRSSGRIRPPPPAGSGSRSPAVRASARGTRRPSDRRPWLFGGMVEVAEGAIGLALSRTVAALTVRDARKVDVCGLDAGLDSFVAVLAAELLHMRQMVEPRVVEDGDGRLDRRHEGSLVDVTLRAGARD